MFDLKNRIVAGALLAAASLAYAPVAAAQDASAAVVAAGTYALDASHTTVAARISHLGFSETTVTFPRTSGSLTFDPTKPEAAKLEVTIDIAGLSSGWEARDGHLKGAQFFDVAQHPTATYRATGLTMLGAGRARVDGELMLRGVTKAVPLTVTFNKAGAGMMKEPRIGFSATAELKRSDFGMTAFLPGVGDAVKVAIDSEFVGK